MTIFNQTCFDMQRKYSIFQGLAKHWLPLITLDEHEHLLNPINIGLTFRLKSLGAEEGEVFFFKPLGAEYLVFVLSRSLKTREKHTN